MPSAESRNPRQIPRTQKELDARRKSSLSHRMTLKQVHAAAKALDAAVNLSVDGNISELGRRCDVTSQAALNWVRSGVVPVQRVQEVCAALDGLVTAKELRPDVFTSVE